jgi:hypothetical protein
MTLPNDTTSLLASTPPVATANCLRQLQTGAPMGSKAGNTP